MKIAIKRLTESDLTIFKWQFHNRNVGNQKAINLNADVFVDQLFPSLRESPPPTGWAPINLFIYGPGPHVELNLQRKIVKGAGYKNWRLNGEFISNPDDGPTRFNSLAGGDIAILGFDGTPVPSTLYLFLLSAQEDEPHRTLLDGLLGSARMKEVSESEFGRLLLQGDFPEDHPLWGLDTLATDLEEAAEGAAEPRLRVARRIGGRRRIDRAQLAKARDSADQNGRRGEEIVRAYLVQEESAGRIAGYTWTSDVNAVAPHDFEISVNGTLRRIEVKSTSGDFNRPFHISMAELTEATETTPFDIVRVSNVDVALDSAEVHISCNFNNTARDLLEACRSLPQGVTVDALSIDPQILQFRGIGKVSIPES